MGSVGSSVLDSFTDQNKEKSVLLETSTSQTLKLVSTETRRGASTWTPPRKTPKPGMIVKRPDCFQERSPSLVVDGASQGVLPGPFWSVSES